MYLSYVHNVQIVADIQFGKLFLSGYMMTPRTKNRDKKLDKRRNLKEVNSWHQEKGKSKKTKKRYKRNDSEETTE